MNLDKKVYFIIQMNKMDGYFSKCRFPIFGLHFCCYIRFCLRCFQPFLHVPNLFCAFSNLPFFHQKRNFSLLLNEILGCTMRRCGITVRRRAALLEK